MNAELTERMKALWWYYSPQLADQTMVKGNYADNYPYPPRMMQRRMNFKGADCLDIGSAEGLLPILAAKRGARSVTATDYDEANLEKLCYLAECHKVSLGFRSIGRAQRVRSLIKEFPTGFDYINISGLLYHVTSPLDVLGAARTLLRPHGHMLVSTICVLDERCFMEFNDRGRFQPHHNVFWYISTGMLEYTMRLLSLVPHDLLCLGKDGLYYVSVLCQATDDQMTDSEDKFAPNVLLHSLEFDQWRKRRTLPQSEIKRDFIIRNADAVRQHGGLNITREIELAGSVGFIASSQDSRVFMLGDMD